MVPAARRVGPPGPAGARRPVAKASLEPFDLSAAPGHLIRRAQQLHTALWSEHVSTSYTSLQFAALAASAGLPELDQTRLGELVGADRSTIAEVVRRLCDRGLLERRRSVDDARRNELRVTPQGVAVLRDLQPRVVALGEVLSAPLDEGERVELRRLLTKLVTSPGPR